jgi:hypothetical protein
MPRPTRKFTASLGPLCARAEGGRELLADYARPRGAGPACNVAGDFQEALALPRTVPASLEHLLEAQVVRSSLRSARRHMDPN